MSVRWISATDRAILDFDCPKCGAKADEPCITKQSRQPYSIGNYHAARRDAELFARSRAQPSAGESVK